SPVPPRPVAPCAPARTHERQQPTTPGCLATRVRDAPGEIPVRAPHRRWLRSLALLSSCAQSLARGAPSRLPGHVSAWQSKSDGVTLSSSVARSYGGSMDRVKPKQTHLARVAPFGSRLRPDGKVEPLEGDHGLRVEDFACPDLRYRVIDRHRDDANVFALTLDAGGVGGISTRGDLSVEEVNALLRTPRAEIHGRDRFKRTRRIAGLLDQLAARASFEVFTRLEDAGRNFQ